MAAISIDGTPMTALPADAEQINYDNTSSGMSATQVQAAVDELKSGLITMRTEELTFTNAGYNLFTNNGTYTKAHHTLISSDDVYVIMGGAGFYVRLIEYSNTTGNLVPCSESTVTMNCIIIEWD